MAWKKKLTPQEKEDYKAKKKETLTKLFQQIDDGVQAVFDSDRYKEYLKVMSKFTSYSFSNCMLIAMQKPDASLVAGYGKWKALGRQVNQGEKGIMILAPMPYKRKSDDPDEEEETAIAFKATYVFDVSQTSGKDLPDYVQDLEGEIEQEQMTAVFDALRKAVGIPISFEDIPGTSHGYYSTGEDRIVIQTGMSDAQTVKTGIHECAHKLLHDKNLEIATVQSDRSGREVQAESVAFIVAEHFGLDTSEYSFPYIAGWSKGKPSEELSKYLTEIQEAAKTLVTAITEGLAALEQSQVQEESEEEEIDHGGMAM